MKKIMLENNGREPIDYLWERQWELKNALGEKFFPEVVREIIDVLRTTDFMVVKKVPVRI